MIREILRGASAASWGGSNIFKSKEGKGSTFGFAFPKTKSA
jgi:signal transduction histidine kinase